jgi:glycine betaine/choline ABC-type transport system substrate-binding protein
MEVRMGTKDFTEQFLLGKMMAQLIEIDLYPDYTGTGLTAILDKKVGEIDTSVSRYVRRMYRDKFDCAWLEPFGFNNTCWQSPRSVTAAPPCFSAAAARRL